MAKYIGYQNNQIILVSDKKISSPDYSVLEIPKELESISVEDLILNYQIKNSKLEYKKSTKNPQDLKVALVGNWKMQCGIATYAYYLWSELIPKLGEVKLFIEENEFPTSSVLEYQNGILSSDQVVTCWKRGEPLNKLIQEIKQFQPDIVFIQHEWGLWSNARHWLSLMTQLNQFRVIVTMHSTYSHADKTICEAAIPEIVVHLQGAKETLLQEKQLSNKVYLIPHGCYSLTNNRLWNFYKSPKTFMQMGFGFSYKNFECSLEIVKLLKDKHPEIFFTGLFSESEFNKVGHQQYFNKLLALIEEYKISNHVSIIRGFQSDAVLQSFLGTNQVAIFPYLSAPGHEVWGASGAARLAMAAGIPVITSKIRHFSDLPTLQGNNAEEMATWLDQIFSNPELKQQQIIKQNKYIIENSWTQVAQQYLNLFSNYF